MLVQTILDYLEEHLEEPLELAALADALHYSKYYLLHEFTRETGQPLITYLQRRRLTEAARRLINSEKPILEIALSAGYESQQAFSIRFKKMYKYSPAAFRKTQFFYPLQLPLRLDAEPSEIGAPVPAASGDLPEWIALARLTADGLPGLQEAEYARSILKGIRERRAWMIPGKQAALGAAVFSGGSGRVELLTVHPQYRGRGLERKLLHHIQRQCGVPISLTTFRERDPADPGYRAALLRLGFRPDALLSEFGYPTQRLVLPKGVLLP